MRLYPIHIDCKTHEIIHGLIFSSSRIRTFRNSSPARNMVHGSAPEQVLQDEEGLQIMHTLGRNMVWILKSIEAGKKTGVAQPEAETKVFTNFIR